MEPAELLEGQQTPLVAGFVVGVGTEVGVEVGLALGLQTGQPVAGR
jgi:hypothetical protein